MNDFILYKILNFCLLDRNNAFDIYLVWYLFAVQLFSVVEEGTGVCKLSEYNNKR